MTPYFKRMRIVMEFTTDGGDMPTLNEVLMTDFQAGHLMRALTYMDRIKQSDDPAKPNLKVYLEEIA